MWRYVTSTFGELGQPANLPPTVLPKPSKKIFVKLYIANREPRTPYRLSQGITHLMFGRFGVWQKGVVRDEATAEEAAGGNGGKGTLWL